MSDNVMVRAEKSVVDLIRYCKELESEVALLKRRLELYEPQIIKSLTIFDAFESISFDNRSDETQRVKARNAVCSCYGADFPVKNFVGIPLEELANNKRMGIMNLAVTVFVLNHFGVVIPIPDVQYVKNTSIRIPSLKHRVELFEDAMIIKK